jgi:hypothetical protein
MEKFLRGLKYFAGLACIGFTILFFTAPALFGIVFISFSAIGSIIVYATVGGVLGAFIPERKKATT